MNSETLLNEKVAKGLRAQFSPERSAKIIERANEEFSYRDPNANHPELYELFEGGYLDRALEELGYGRWAIGRPGPRPNGNTRVQHVQKAKHHPSDQRSEGISTPNATDLFLRHIPKPNELRAPSKEWANAIEYRNLLIIGQQGSGKTTLCQSFAEALANTYRGYGVFAGIQVAGINRLLDYGTRQRRTVWFLAGEDLTLANIPSHTVNQFFQVRTLIWKRTGLNRGLVVTSFNSHTLFGIDKNLRTTFTMMFVRSVPTNPYDRSLLRKYFDPLLLERFEKLGSTNPGLVLVWDPLFAPRGVIANATPPEENMLEELKGPTWAEANLGRVIVTSAIFGVLMLGLWWLVSNPPS